MYHFYNVKILGLSSPCYGVLKPDIKVKNRLTIPDNEDYWKLFEGDKHIDDFLQSKNDFAMPTLVLSHKEDFFNEEQNPETTLSFSTDVNHSEHPFGAEIVDNTDQKDLEILHCKNDTIPRGLIPLEQLFDFNDVAKEPRMEPIEVDIEEHNISSPSKPEMIKLSSTLPAHIKQQYIDLFKEFKDVFAWGYKDLKSYDTSIIQHKIPLKENQKPFKQKLRRINPVLFPLVEKEIKKMYDVGIIVPIRYS